ncbi:hypothetical protein A2U01_0016478, partial [Trifolium medium]|nr:hypothetical protein [Trifolium medium]
KLSENASRWMTEDVMPWRSCGGGEEGCGSG